MSRKVAIVVFDDVEVLDFCGPFEVFAIAQKIDQETQSLSSEFAFEVLLVAEKSGPVKTRGGMIVQPHHSFSDLPKVEILIVPGGQGTRREMFNEKMIEFICERESQVDYLLTVCTGSLLLAKAGLLDGLSTTTHQGALDLLTQHAPKTNILRDMRIVDNGKIVSSGGISAGIDMSLYMISRLVGQLSTDAAIKRMEYDYHVDPSKIWKMN